MSNRQPLLSNQVTYADSLRRDNPQTRLALIAADTADNRSDVEVILSRVLLSN